MSYPEDVSQYNKVSFNISTTKGLNVWIKIICDGTTVVDQRYIYQIFNRETVEWSIPSETKKLELCFVLLNTSGYYDIHDIQLIK